MDDFKQDQEQLDIYWMGQALQLAQAAADSGEVPVGAILVRDGQCIGRGSNRPIAGCDPSAHAEIVALRDAALQQRNYRLSGATLYVTIEPCTMCFGAMQHARIQRLVYGAAEPRAGVVASQLRLAESDFYNHRILVTAGVLEQPCGDLLREFFRVRR